MTESISLWQPRAQAETRREKNVHIGPGTWEEQYHVINGSKLFCHFLFNISLTFHFVWSLFAHSLPILAFEAKDIWMTCFDLQKSSSIFLKIHLIVWRKWGKVGLMKETNTNIQSYFSCFVSLKYYDFLEGKIRIFISLHSIWCEKVVFDFFEAFNKIKFQRFTLDIKGWALFNVANILSEEIGG